MKPQQTHYLAQKTYSAAQQYGRDNAAASSPLTVPFLPLFTQEMAAKKAALLEGKARREERTKAVANRSASVVRLMELEADGIRIEKEAVVSLLAHAAHDSRRYVLKCILPPGAALCIISFPPSRARDPPTAPVKMVFSI